MKESLNTDITISKDDSILKISKWRADSFFLLGIALITLGMLIGLVIGIVFSQKSRESVGSWQRAIDILESYPVIDGYIANH